MRCIHREPPCDLPAPVQRSCHAFQRDERVMVVWTYDLDSIIPTCRDFEEKLIKLVWNRRSTNVSLASLCSL